MILRPLLLSFLLAAGFPAVEGGERADSAGPPPGERAAVETVAAGGGVWATPAPPTAPTPRPLLSPHASPPPQPAPPPRRQPATVQQPTTASPPPQHPAPRSQLALAPPPWSVPPIERTVERRMGRSGPRTPSSPLAADTLPLPGGAPGVPADTVPDWVSGDTVPDWVSGDTIPDAVPGDTVPEADEGDLAFRVQGRGEFGGDWTRFRPCDASFQITCNPGLVPQLHPDVLLGVEAAGSVADRIFIDIDYDQTREFGGSNRFQVSYQGREGEILQRVQVGDVTFALPETRFLTRGVPAGNFGLLAQGTLAGVDLQTVFAQQRGARRSRDFRLRSVGGEVGVIQEDTVVVDDAGYVRGQFFFVVDPHTLPGAPHLDVLALRPGAAPPLVAPGPEPIQLYRMERDPVLRQQVEGFIQADAVAENEEGEVRESGWFRHLRPGIDYYLHPSGLWAALRSPLRPDEALAVAYINVLGDSIGVYNPESAANRGEIPTLELLRATRPQHQPGRPTWEREMRQIYRISGSPEVDLGAMRMTISLGEESGGRTFKEAPDGRRIPLLRLFGLDDTAPFDQLDRRALFQPMEELSGERGIEGTFLVFPTLRPFLDPPPVRSEGLDPEGARAVLGGDANSRIYEAEDPFEREASSLYRLNLDVTVRSTGLTSTVVLGAFGVREGSERVFLGDRLLRPEIDYLMDYRSGIVTLLQPDALLARSSSDRLQVSWEEAAVFRSAPASVLGLNASVPMGDGGTVDIMGLYQIERELVNRPRFGAEPGALGMVGARSSLDYGVPGLDAFLDRLPGRVRESSSRFRVDGEMALSLPDPNISGDAYLDDFDSGDERSISLLSREWHLGSRPAFRDGAEGVLPQSLDASNVASLVWQHNWIEHSPQGDSVGVFEGFLTQDEIDRQINFAGSQTREPGLRVGFGQEQGPIFNQPRWRSLTTLLSPNGLDLTQTEHLDFYVAEGDSLTLILDLGMVSEDRFFVDDQRRTSGFRTDTAEPWGLGTLDQEADPLRGEIWSPESDARGLWPESCRADPGRIYRPGDPRANCTRGNGRRDTEDLNQNGILDTLERYRRYVVRLDGSSPYLVRDRSQTGTRFRLYRIPLRGASAYSPGGAFTEADWRSVQFLRITAAGPRSANFTLARMRLVGSRWLKRGPDGVLRGISGDTTALLGNLEVSPVSILTDGGAYRAPPGVLAQLDDPTSAIGGQGVEFGEKSLSLRYRDLGEGDRAEVYFRFLQRPRNFLNYERLRVWALARRGDWAGAQGSDFFLKVGSDPENFYLYRTRLAPAGDPEAVLPEDWLPEHNIDFRQWTELRRLAEEELLQAPPGPGDPPVTVWSADSTYAVVLRDRARAPNLAAVREIAMGVWNREGAPTTGELWVNELRLGGGSRAGGSARIVNVALDGGDLFQARMGYTGQGPDFRQMDEMASFQADGALSLGGTVQTGRLLPEAWGVRLPVTVSHQRSSRDPFFLAGTDLRADLLPGLRAPGFSETRVSLALAADGETGAAWADRVLPGADFRLSVLRSSGSTVTSETEVWGSEWGVGYRWEPGEHTVGLLPGILEPVARILLPPGWFRSLSEARLRWTPHRVSTGADVRHREQSLTRFSQILATTPADPGFTEVTAEAWLENRVRVEMRPLATLDAMVELRSTRDLLEPAPVVPDPRVLTVIEAERIRLLGQNLGWETARVIEGRVGWRPPLPPWLRADLGLNTRFRSDRNSGLIRFTPGEDPVLLRNAGGERDMRANLTLDPARLLGGGESPTPRSADRPPIQRVAGILSPLTLNVQQGITSWYYREAIDPGSIFQFGLGGRNVFGRVDGTAATTLVDRSGLTAGSGVRVGDGFFAQVNYQDIEATSLDRRTERATRNRSWPDLRAGMGAVPIPEEWEGAVTRISFSSGWQQVREQVTFGDAILQQRTREELRVPFEVVVEWGGGVSTRYRGLLGSGEGRDPTGTTERYRRDHGFSVETRFTPGGGLGERIQEPLTLSLLLDWSAVQECRVMVAVAQCVLFVDHIERGANVSVATLVSDLEVGGHLAFLDRRSYTGMRTGRTQFQLGIWARMIFEAGPLERLARPTDPF